MLSQTTYKELISKNRYDLSLPHRALLADEAECSIFLNHLEEDDPNLTFTAWQGFLLRQDYCFEIYLLAKPHLKDYLTTFEIEVPFSAQPVNLLLAYSSIRFFLYAVKFSVFLSYMDFYLKQLRPRMREVIRCIL